MGYSPKFCCKYSKTNWFQQLLGIKSAEIGMKLYDFSNLNPQLTVMQTKFIVDNRTYKTGRLLPHMKYSLYFKPVIRQKPPYYPPLQSLKADTYMR